MPRQSELAGHSFPIFLVEGPTHTSMVIAMRRLYILDLR